jgi:hypothetical protein
MAVYVTDATWINEINWTCGTVQAEEEVKTQD